jgi:hypothetical protein
MGCRGGICFVLLDALKKESEHWLPVPQQHRQGTSGECDGGLCADCSMHVRESKIDRHGHSQPQRAL